MFEPGDLAVNLVKLGPGVVADIGAVRRGVRPERQQRVDLGQPLS